jgi:hypothetical protein
MVNRTDEEALRQYVLEHGMALGELKPAFTIQLTKQEASFLKDAAAFKAEEEGWTGHIQYWEAAYLSEFGLHSWLKGKNKRHKWASLYFGGATEASQDFVIWRKGKRYTVGVSSRRHMDLVNYLDDPQQFYPYRRLRRAGEQIGHYTISSSVFTNRDDSVTVAYWGAMTRGQLVKRLGATSPEFSHPSKGDYGTIPLRWFNPDLLVKLIESIDEG